MRFLVDESLGPQVAELLRLAGHDAEHVHQVGLGSASDPVILDRAAAEDQILVTGDADFGMLLARGGSIKPSVVFFRGDVSRRPEALVSVLLVNLSQIEAELLAGAIAVFGDRRLRLRQLPMGPDQSP